MEIAPPAHGGETIDRACESVILVIITARGYPGALRATVPYAPRMTHMMAMPVRVFERRAIREAIAFAQTGGIALHFFRWSHPHFGTGEYCHVLSADRDLLIAFGAAYDFPPSLLQPPRRGRGVWHYDAFGWRAAALRRLAGKIGHRDTEDTEGEEGMGE